MYINKISTNLITNKIFENKYQKKGSQKNDYQTSYTTLSLNIPFEARVDKGLLRFYEVNVERMPKTVKRYIESLPEKQSKTPLQAQAEAFAGLIGATTISSIQSIFSEDKDLFEDLKNPDDSKATRGILNTYRENKELLNLCDQSILANKENLTIWLVKKIFLEGKTLNEINNDFELEADKDFLALHRQKNDSENNEFIRSSTLKALGIKSPEFEYQQSLRYTREGFSDYVGQKIKDFYASLPINERTARNKKRVQKFENWWNSISHDEKLEMIARKSDELELLKNFKQFKTEKTKQIRHHENPTINYISKQKTEKTETTLSDDELFKAWATLNLEIFKANLTEYDKNRIEIKRIQNRANWWKSMPPEEQTDYINKLRMGLEPVRFALIDLWNNNPDILIKLSYTLKKNHIERPDEVLYGTVPFDKHLSDVLSRFWENNPDLVERMQISLKESHAKIKDSMKNGHFEILKKDLLKLRNKRIEDVKTATKNFREILNQEDYEKYPQYMKDFINAYNTSEHTAVNFLPIKYVRQYYDVIEKSFEPSVIKTWTKCLRQEEDFTPEDVENIGIIRKTETYEAAIISRALEAAVADILYECTQDPDVYIMSHTDCKFALKQVVEGNEQIELYSSKLDKTFKIPINKNASIDTKKLDKLYNTYSEPLTNAKLEEIIDQYVIINNDFLSNESTNTKTEKERVKEKLQTYRSSLKILLDDKKSPEIKSKFAQKILYNRPLPDLTLYDLKISTIDDFNIESKIKNICDFMNKKYYFIPKDILKIYTSELSKVLRANNSISIKMVEEKCCTKRKNSSDHSKIILLNREGFNPSNQILSLCFEQAMADCIYESCGKEDVYALQMEELLSLLEAIMLVKKFPLYDFNNFSSKILGRDIELPLKSRIKPYDIEMRFKEYYNEVNEYVKECKEENKNISKEELLYILNPEENKVATDELTKMRIDATVKDKLYADKS